MNNLPPCVDGKKYHDFSADNYEVCVNCRKTWYELWVEMVDKISSRRKVQYKLQHRVRP